MQKLKKKLFIKLAVAKKFPENPKKKIRYKKVMIRIYIVFYICNNLFRFYGGKKEKKNFFRLHCTAQLIVTIEKEIGYSHQ